MTSEGLFSCELVITVLEHRRTKPDSSWAVARVELAEVVSGSVGPALLPGANFAAVGPRLGLAAPGEGLRVRGAFGLSSFGEQFKIEEQSTVGITSSAQAGRWLERLDGVGPKRAARLAAHFGERVVDVLKAVLLPGEADPLTEVEGISPTVAQTIRESWDELGASGSIEDLRYLDGLGLTRFESNSVLDYARKRGLTPKALLETSPFDLTQARGFGFKRTDVVALKAGCARHAPARLEAAAVFQTLECCDGDTMVRLGQLVKQASDLVGVESLLVLSAITRLSASGRLVLLQDEKGTRWVHPPDLVQAERCVFRLVRDQDQDDDRGAPTLEVPSVEQANVVSNVATAATLTRANAIAETIRPAVAPWE